MDFKLEWRDRRIGARGTLGNQTPRRFLDFVVDGESLYESHGMDFISALGWLKPDEDEQIARRLLLEEGPELDERVAIYVCPECADLYCGAITAKIERQEDELVWREMGFSEMDWSEDIWLHDPAGFDTLQVLRFPASQYENAILSRPKPLP